MTIILVIGHWSLGLGWSLGFGHWSFEQWSDFHRFAADLG
jgi:hypothetical protein